ncbi:MAG: M3 family oligoendopeptidase [Bdellovibrionales bacterium]
MNTPAWNIESEYPSIGSKAFVLDFQTAAAHLRLLEQTGRQLVLDLARADTDAKTLESVQDMLILNEQVSILISNLHTYLHCRLSVDASDNEARSKFSEVEALASQLAQIMAPLSLFVQQCTEDQFESLISHPELKGYEFLLRRQRTQAPYLLSPQEEVLLSALNVTGHSAWGHLYEALTGNGKCELRFPDGSRSVVGLSEAHAMLYGADAIVRQAAWDAIQEFWTFHRQTGAAILNALSGWRLEVNRKRSHTRPRDFLDQPLYENRITRDTLDAMIEACRRNLPKLRRAPKLMARTMKKDRLDPWDLVAPSPVAANSAPRSFDMGIDLVKKAFGTVAPEFSAFVDMMVKQQWIEARVLSTKVGGAYCTEFAKSLEPRVFQSYMGSLPDITTLAHELGHAFHSWVIRDLPRGEQNYPMTLAETASVFAEMTLRDVLFKSATSLEEKLEFAWNDLESAVGYLINVPARFEFEKAFYERRQERVVSADELMELNDQVWSTWYGDTLTSNDKMFWAHKAHFSFAELSFYNFPYTFGYLFSLSIYARRDELGDGFMSLYRAVLRDTGRMTAEDLVEKHLGEDIRQPQFWQKAIDAVVTKIDRFESLLHSEG